MKELQFSKSNCSRNNWKIKVNIELNNMHWSYKIVMLLGYLLMCLLPRHMFVSLE